MKTLTLIGRRWNDTYGNTYFSACALLDMHTLREIEFEYGYDGQWLDTITDKLNVEGFVRGDREAPWRFLKELEEEHGIKVEQNIQDVKRKKDLMFK